jgi:hypothetical protein
LATASLLNTHLRDQLDFLKAPPTGNKTLNEAANYTTNSTSFVDIDSTNLSLTINTAGGDVLIIFTGTFSHNTAGGRVFLDVSVDGTDMFGDDGLVTHGCETANRQYAVTLVAWKLSLSAGSHTFRLRWRTNTGILTLYAGAGTSLGDVHPQFVVREVS